MDDQTANRPIPYRRTEKGIAPRNLTSVLYTVLSMACKRTDQQLLEEYLRHLVEENPESFLRHIRRAEIEKYIKREGV